MKSIYKIGLTYIVGILIVLLTCKLGLWQLSRAQYKAEKNRQWSRAAHGVPVDWQCSFLPIEYQKLTLSGQWLLSQQILLDNRMRNGQPGFQVITPMRLARKNGATCIVPINRGWVARSSDVEQKILPPLTQTVTVRRESLPRFFEFQHQKDDYIWQNLDWQRYQKKIGLALYPIYTVAISELHDQLKRDWPPPNLGEMRHRSYAVQWFSLSALGLIILVYYTFILLLKVKKTSLYTNR